MNHEAAGPRPLQGTYLLQLPCKIGCRGIQLANLVVKVGGWEAGREGERWENSEA